jgi:hypothetical protein
MTHHLYAKNWLYSIKLNDTFFEYQYRKWFMTLLRFFNLAQYLVLPVNVIYDYQLKKSILGYKLDIYLYRLDYTTLLHSGVSYSKVGCMFISDSKTKDRLEWRLKWILKKNQNPHFTFLTEGQMLCNTKISEGIQPIKVRNKLSTISKTLHKWNLN